MKQMMSHNININAIAPSSAEEMLNKSILAAKRKDFLKRVNEATALVEELHKKLEKTFNMDK